MTHRRFVSGLLWLAPVALGFILAAMALAERQTEGDDGERLRIRGVTYLGDLPTLVADKYGFFEAEGINPVVQYGFSGKRNLERLRAGETDFALMALTPLVIDMLTDESPHQADDPVILANLVHATNLNQVVSLQQRNMPSPADLSGKRIGLMKGTNAEIVWWLFAVYHGLDPATIELVDMPVETIGDALVGDEIDAAVLWEPWITHLRHRTGEGIRTYPGGDLYTAKWVIVALRQTVADRPDETRALLRAYRSAIESIDRHGDEALAMFAEHAGVSIESLHRLRADLSYELSLDWSVVASLQQQVRWGRDAGHVKQLREIDLLAFFEAGPLRALAPEAVSLSVLDDKEPAVP